MKHKEYFKDFDDFDDESQQVLLSAYNSMLTPDAFHQNKLQSKLFSQKTNSSTESSSSSDIIDWETDEYFDLKKLAGNIWLFKNQYGNFQLLYNIKDFKSNSQNKSISDGKNNIRLKVYRNPKAGNVSLKIADVIISQQIDAGSQKIYYRLTFHYVNSDERAFILETYSYQELKNLNIFLGYVDIEKYPEAGNYFLKNFANALRDETDAVRLKFIYANIPDSILSNLSTVINSDTFFNHLAILTKYDKDGIFSGLKDGSPAVIQIFKALKNSQNILDHYRKFPEELNTIYYNLDGKSEYEGQQLGNRKILANILLVLSMFSKSETKADKTFTIGKGYKINAELSELGSVLGFGNSDAGTFFLQQQKEETVSYSVQSSQSMGTSGTTTKTVDTNVDQGAQFHPLDMVYLKDIGGETEQTYLVPAIYLKALADAEEWEVVMQNIRIAADLVAVVIGVLTLPTGNPYFLLLAIADITLAGADITIQVFKDEIIKYEGGAEFLETWENIYTVGGFAVAGLTLVGGFYISAARLLTKIADGSAKTYLKTLILKAVLETNISNFQKNTLKVVEPKEIFLGAQYKVLGQEMAENGVIFLSGQKEGKFAESYAAMYKGAVIEEFSKAELSNFYKKWGKLTGTEMEEALEQSAKRGIKKIGAVEYEMLSSSLLTKYTQDMVDLCRKKGISLEVKWIDETHPRFNEPDYMGGFRITESKNKVILNLRPECPKITLYHERWHLEDFLEMGWKRYTDISKKTPWLHEEAVWKRVYQNRNKWSELETVDAYLYYQDYIWKKSNFKLKYQMREVESLLPKYEHLIKK